jgi:hypothetical protein
MRDNGCCMYCHHVNGRTDVLAAETDHVYGRGSANAPELESWRYRLTLCTPCHYEKHHGKNGWFSIDKEIEALEQAISRPQMTSFSEKMVATNVILRMGLIRESAKRFLEMVVSSGEKRVRD